MATEVNGLVQQWPGITPEVLELMRLIPGTYQPFPKGTVVGLCKYSPAVCNMLIEERNAFNRPQIKSNTRYLRNVLQAGEWQLTGETLIFDWDGNIRNGQHRLRGCIEADVEFEAFTVMGIDPNAFKVMDQGIRRGFSHVLAIEGEKNVSAVSAALTCLMNFRDFGTLHSKRSERVSIGMFEEMLAKHPTVRDSVRVCKQRDFDCFPSTGVTTALHYLFGCVSPEKRDEMFSGMVNMSMPEEPKWSGPRSMRLRLNTTRGRDLNKENIEYAALMIKTWNLFYKEKAIKAVRWRQDEGNMEEYPHVEGWTYDKDGLPICAGRVQI